jgi:hypothetical protein
MSPPLAATDPHMGRLSRHVKPQCEATSLRIVPGTVHLSTKNAREMKRTPARQEEGPGSPNRPLKSDLLKFGPPSHVNLLLDAKVISSLLSNCCKGL